MTTAITSMRAYALLSCWLLLTLWGCERDKTPVPFKRSESVVPAADGEHENPAAPEPSEAPAEAREHAVEYPDGTRRVTLSGSVLERGEGAYRASLAVDLDADGTRDALLLVSDARGRPVLETARRHATGLTAAGSLPLIAAEVSCSVGRATLETIGAGVALVSAQLACELAGANAPPAPNEPSYERSLPPHLAAPAALHRYVVTLEPAPRLLLHSSLRAPVAGEAAAELELSLTARDLDQDEHPDLRLTLALRTAFDSSSERDVVELDWLNRPSGLARESDEPERTIAALAGDALHTFPQKPARALALADRALALHSLLCRESHKARLVIDGQLGVSCARSAGAGRAAAVRVLTLAKQRALVPALEAAAQLASPAFHAPPALEARVKRALGELPGDSSYTWQMGPAVDLPEAPPVRLPVAAFTTDERMLVRGVTAKEYDLTEHTLTPLAAAGSVLVADPSGGIAVTEVVRDCGGRRLITAQVRQGILDVVANAQASELHFAPEPVIDPGCGPRAMARDPGEYVVLGASAEGVVVAKHDLLFTVPFAGSASPARTLASHEPAPPLLAPGALSKDGLRHVLATSQGLLLVQRGSSVRVTLVRPPASCSGGVSDAAISPSGHKLAMVCGGHLYVARSRVETGEASSPPPSEPDPQPSAATPATSDPGALPSTDTLPSTRALLDLPPPEPERDSRTPYSGGSHPSSP